MRRCTGLLSADLALVLALLSLTTTGVTAQVRSPGAGRLVVVAAPQAPPPGAARLGPLSSQSRVILDVVLKPRDPRRLAAIAMAVSTPGSRLRGDYLSPAQLRSEFGPSTAEVGSVIGALTAAGLRVFSVTPDHLTIQVSASENVLARALHTSFARYRLGSGRIGYANTASAVLPASISGHVQALIGLSDLARFVPLAARPSVLSTSKALPRTTPGPLVQGAISGRPRASVPSPCLAAASEHVLQARTADQLASAYGMTGLYAAGDYGAGVTVGVFELEQDAPSDIAAYEACYGIAAPVSYIKVDGGAPGPAYGSGEAALDIEDVAGLAPQAKIEVYQAPNNSVGPFDEFQYIVDHPSAKVVTTSWGECESFLGNTPAWPSAAAKAAVAESTLFELAAAEGQSWIAAAGDSGATDCMPSPGVVESQLAVDDPGSQPFVTSVGGTSLYLNANGPFQTVWNDSASQQGAGGGGISEMWPMPAYQTGAPASLGVINNESSAKACHVLSGYCREVPDVTADADPDTGYAYYYEGAWSSIGGTSGGAPLWAAVTALTDASTRCAGRSVGFLNPALYAVAGSSSYAGAFTDITTGNNDYTPSGQADGLFRAMPGYDMASGLGSPLVTSPSGGLALALCSSLGDLRPGVDSISPATGPTKGGNRVIIAGYGFSGVTAVYFGTRRAKFLLQQALEPAPTKIVATVPPGSGKQWVVVHVGKYTSALAPGDQYTYR
ncbi:MAG: protease pro-enzyme activation domain-containing protein [Acidimicrobiales bacterium]